jgi:high-affinity Fe2+/Pb2+ permease
MPDFDRGNAVDAELQKLRSNISDLGYQIDSYKTKTAAALGGGVFLTLLAAGAGYDLLTSNGGVWLSVGLDHQQLVWVSGTLAVVALILLVTGFVRLRRRDFEAQSRLDQMERQYSEILERSDVDHLGSRP